MKEKIKPQTRADWPGHIYGESCDCQRCRTSGRFKKIVGYCPACGDGVASDDPDGPVWTCPADLAGDNPFRLDPNPAITEDMRERSGCFSNCGEDFGLDCYERIPLHSACYDKGDY